MALKVLRIGIIEGGRIIDERRIVRGEPVSIEGRALFEVHEGGWRLRSTPAMTGRVEIGGSAVDLASLPAELPLDESCRGKIVFGRTTVLFQFVDPPAAKEKLRLPPDLRGAWIQGIDRQFAAILAASMLLTFSAAAYATTIVWVEPSLRELEEEGWFVAPIVDRIPEPPLEPSAAVTPAKARGSGRPEPGSVRDARPGGPAHKTLLDLIGAAGRGGGGKALQEMFSEGGFDQDLGQAFLGSRGISTAREEAGTRGDGGGGGPVTLGNLGTDLSVGPVGVGGKREAELPGTVDVAGTPLVDGALDPEMVARELRGRIRALKACYDRELKRFPTLAGKLVLAFAIDGRGRVGGVSFGDNSLNSRAIERCIRERAEAWRFPEPPDGRDVAIEFPLIFAPPGG
jgi:hypothetical protein